MVDASTPFELSATNEVVNSGENDFQLSAGTLMGVRSRPCPCCKKMFKTERLGEHIRKMHNDFWNGAFTVQALEAAITEKRLASITTEYEDHDQNYLVCLACNSIRTTDRNHFTKNGERHLNAHIEECKKLLAQKTGKKYTPEAVSIITNLQLQLDHFKRLDAYCRKHHTEDTETSDKLQAAEAKLKIQEQELFDLETERNLYKEKCTRYNKVGRAAYNNLTQMDALLSKVYQKDAKALEKFALLLGEARAFLQM